jgi:TPR repeat protein
MGTDYRTSDGRQFSGFTAGYDAERHQAELDRRRAENEGRSSRPQEPQGPDQGTLLWREGKQLFEAGNYDKAILKLTQSINAGGINKALAYVDRGKCYANKENYDQAIDDYTEVLNIGFSCNNETNSAVAYLDRGLSYENKGNTDQAIADYKKSADLDPSGEVGKDALVFLANLEGSILVDQGNAAFNAKDYAKANELFRKAADMGSAVAQYNLGNSYYNGHGVTKDYAKAKEWYEKAGAQGYANAKENLANFDSSILVDQGLAAKDAGNYAKALELYQKAADMGNSSGIMNIGFLYYQGLGVPKDTAKAVELWKKAADMGNQMAQHNLGCCYQDGIGVTQNYTKAAEYFEKAAAQGKAASQSNLGVLYRDGKGVKQDFAKAEQWLNKAVAQGNETAKKELAKLKEMRGR